MKKIYKRLKEMMIKNGVTEGENEREHEYDKIKEEEKGRNKRKKWESKGSGKRWDERRTRRIKVEIKDTWNERNEKRKKARKGN